MNAMKTAEKTETAVRAALHALHEQNACCYISLQRTEGNLYLKKLCHIYLQLVQPNAVQLQAYLYNFS